MLRPRQQPQAHLASVCFFTQRAFIHKQAWLHHCQCELTGRVSADVEAVSFTQRRVWTHTWRKGLPLDQLHTVNIPRPRKFSIGSVCARLDHMDQREIQIVSELYIHQVFFMSRRVRPDG